MMLAQEAYEQSRDVLNSKIDNELKEIEGYIIQAISAGTFSVTRDGYISREVVNKLQELGYKVDTGSQYNQSYYSISWK